MTRLDHTDCGHALTPAARKRCRDWRNAKIKALQAAYMEMMDDPNFSGQREYEAMVDLFSGQIGMDLHDTYNLIENGPVL
jgi:hypothetical protein